MIQQGWITITGYGRSRELELLASFVIVTDVLVVLHIINIYTKSTTNGKSNEGTTSESPGFVVSSKSSVHMRYVYVTFFHPPYTTNTHHKQPSFR